MNFPELKRIQTLADKGIFRSKIHETLSYRNKEFPIYSFELGPEKKNVPTLGIFAGVHGLEKIGVHVALHYLESISNQLSWNEHLKELFKKIRLVSIPMINPTGVYYNTRSNYRNIDLMRNSPTQAEEKTPFLVGGQNLSSKLPWFRGDTNEMEVESKCLIQFVKDTIFPSSFAMTLDIHSGFGLQDRLWHPYAKTKKPFPFFDLSNKFASMFNKSHPHNIYKIEPQSDSYITNGDLWDYIFDEHYKVHQGNKSFIPWTLEMGSWIWIKKNPLQAFSAIGPFNPIKPHRFSRVMRRHMPLFQFFLESTNSYKAWQDEPITA